MAANSLIGHVIGGLARVGPGDEVHLRVGAHGRGSQQGVLRRPLQLLCTWHTRLVMNVGRSSSIHTQAGVHLFIYALATWFSLEVLSDFAMPAITDREVKMGQALTSGGTS